MNYEFSLLFGFKLSIVICLLILNIFLLISDKGPDLNKGYLESGISKKVLAQYFNILSGSASIYSLYYAVSKETNKDNLTNEVISLQKKIDELRANNLELSSNNIKLEAENTNSINILTSMKFESDKQYNLLNKIQMDLNNPTIDEHEVSATIALTQSSVFSAISTLREHSNNADYGKLISDELSKNPIFRESENLIVKASDIKESFILSGFLNKLENLDLFGRLAVSLLLLNSALFSATVSLVFVFYGDYLLNKYNIELRYPKLAKIIMLRKQFQKYYLISNFGVIFVVSLVEIIFSVAILALKL